MSSIDASIAELRREIWDKKQELTALYRKRTPEPVADYVLTRDTGDEVHLSQLFGDHDDLILVHNMGRSCSYCTMWADGLVSLQRHIIRRSAFVLCSLDPPDVQRRIKADRGWNFPMVSTATSTLAEDLGFKTERGVIPGVSALHRSSDGTIVRTNWDWFGPYDDYNAAWHLFNLLDGGAGEWSPLPADES